MSGLLDFAKKKCKYCGKELKDMLMERLSEKNCPQSPDGEHHFEDEEKRKVKP